jgi:hypothetical protein
LLFDDDRRSSLAEAAPSETGRLVEIAFLDLTSRPKAVVREWQQGVYFVEKLDDSLAV